MDSLGHLIISSPAQGSIWNAGDILPITWDTSGMSGTAAISIAEILGTPDDPTNEAGAELTVSGDGVTHYKYKLNDGEYGAVTPASETIILSGLLDGTVTVSVIAGDAAGNWQAEVDVTTVSWTVDTQAPVSEATPAGGYLWDEPGRDLVAQ